jgi:hypothetical protein
MAGTHNIIDSKNFFILISFIVYFSFTHLPVRSARHIVFAFYIARNPRGFSLAYPHPGWRALRALTRGYQYCALTGRPRFTLYAFLFTFLKKKAARLQQMI